PGTGTIPGLEGATEGSGRLAAGARGSQARRASEGDRHAAGECPGGRGVPQIAQARQRPGSQTLRGGPRYAGGGGDFRQIGSIVGGTNGTYGTHGAYGPISPMSPISPIRLLMRSPAAVPPESLHRPAIPGFVTAAHPATSAATTAAPRCRR